MKRVFLFSFIYILYASNVFSQVNIYPEVGLNYRPYVLDSWTDEFHHKTPEWYLNIVGEMNLNSKIVLSSKMGYVFRKNTNKVIVCGVLGCDYATYINRDMNFSLNLMYPIFDNVRIGLGGGIYYKLNAHFVEDYLQEEYRKNSTGSFLYNGQFLFDYEYKKFKLIATYQYIFNKTEIGMLVHLINGNNAVSLGFGYQLFKGNSK